MSLKAKYFTDVLREIYIIIEKNATLCENMDDYKKLFEILSTFVSDYNKKNGSLHLSLTLDEETTDTSDMNVIFFLTDYVKGRGSKKILEEKISFKQIIRSERLKELYKLL